MGRIENVTTGSVVADQATVARTFPARVIGLLARRRFEFGEALVFPDCRSIHTIGMRFPIDVVFVSREWRVVAVRSPVAPGRLTVGAWHASATIELPTGTAKRASVRVGDQLRFIDTEAQPSVLRKRS